MVLGLVLVAVMIFVVARPFLAARGVSGSAEFSHSVTLLAEREAVLNALRDLDFDYTLNKIPIENYLTQRAQLVARGAEILRQLDAVALSKAGPLPETEATVEAAIAAHHKTVKRISALTCPYCHTLTSAADKFCGHCGHTLAAVCAHCGQAFESADRFCANCGTAVAVKEIHDEA